MKDNIDRLFEAIDNPERFTDAELDALLSNSDIRKLYDMLSKATDALTDVPKPDIDKEWNSFAAVHDEPKKFLFLNFFQRHAAAIAIWGLTSLAVVAAAIGIKHSFDLHDKSLVNAQCELEIVSSVPDVESDTLTVTASAGPEIVIFKDEPLTVVLSEICDYYNVTVDFDNQNAKDIRLYFKWDQSQTLNEVADQLNCFEQIKIRVNDNVITVE